MPGIHSLRFDRWREHLAQRNSFPRPSAMPWWPPHRDSPLLRRLSEPPSPLPVQKSPPHPPHIPNTHQEGWLCVRFVSMLYKSCFRNLKIRLSPHWFLLPRQLFSLTFHSSSKVPYSMFIPSKIVTWIILTYSACTARPIFLFRTPFRSDGSFQLYGDGAKKGRRPGHGDYVRPGQRLRWTKRQLRLGHKSTVSKPA